MKLSVLLLLCLMACTKYADVSQDSVSPIISSVHMEITDLKEGVWKVGANRSYKVSDSFSFYLKLPKLRSDDMDYLIERGINGWIVRIIFRRAAGEQDLGSTFTSFKPLQNKRSLRASGPAGTVAIKIYYAAKYASERFRSFHCPAFGHNKRITSMEVEGESMPFDFTLAQTIPYEERSQKIGMTPSAFNAGHSLVGSFYVEIAPYNSKKKKILSPFTRLPQSIRVQGEESITVAGCEGVHPELNQ